MAFVLLVAAACASPAKPTKPKPPTASGSQGEAKVDSVQIVLLESFPVQARVEIKGYLPDACTKVEQVIAEREGSTFRIRLTTSRPAEAVCAQMLTPFEESVALDVVGLPAGTYIVDVQGVQDTFTMAVDNVPAPMPAKEIIGEAQVESVELMITRSIPAQVNVRIRGYLPDSCTRIGEIIQERQGDTFWLRVTTARPADKVCTEAPVPFQETIPLDVLGLKAGEYTADVNGVRDRFKLGVDNVQPTRPEPGRVIVREADISEISLRILESMPVQVNVVIKGYFRDGCTKIGQIEQGVDVENKRLWVTVKTQRPADAFCTQAIVPYEQVIPLSVYGLPAGEYTVDVNGATQTLKLEADNVPHR